MTHHAADPLDDLLSQAGITSDHLDADDLDRLWQTLGIDDPALQDEFVETVIDYAAAIDRPNDGDDPRLHLRLGEWRIDLKREGVRAAILLAVTAAVLAHRGLAELGIAFATAILPTVIDIERIQLSAGDRRLLLDLSVKPAFLDAFATEDELYMSLPEQKRRDVNRYDFADFIQRLRDSGLADEAHLEPGSDQVWLRLRHPDDRQRGVGAG